MRTLSQAALEQLAGRIVWPALALHLDYAPAPVRAWSGVGELQYDGATWLGVGHFGEIDGVEEVHDIKASSIKATLRNIGEKNFCESANLPLRGHPLRIDLVLLDPDSGAILEGFTIWRGTVDSYTALLEPAIQGLQVTGVSEMAIIRKSPGLLYDSESQKAVYPDDTALRFVTAIQNSEIRF
jgi:hypothetical protein